MECRHDALCDFSSTPEIQWFLLFSVLASLTAFRFCWLSFYAHIIWVVCCRRSVNFDPVNDILIPSLEKVAGISHFSIVYAVKLWVCCTFQTFVATTHCLGHSPFHWHHMKPSDKLGTTYKYVVPYLECLFPSSALIEITVEAPLGLAQSVWDCVSHQRNLL